MGLPLAVLGAGGPVGVRILVLCSVLAATPTASAAQAPPTGLELAGLPAVNFDADEGFGYGAIAEIYQYGDGSRQPYAWLLQPKVFLTTEGRRDFTIFFDAPGVLAAGWRVDAFVGSEKQIATPYYGIGNASSFDEALDAEEGPNPFYYRFGRVRRRATVSLQRSLGGPLRVLLGAGAVRTTIDPVPEDRGTTLYAIELGATGRTSWSNFVRVGVVWDTRDRETGPRRGTWTDVLVQRVDEALGSEASYTRWTFTDRRYLSLTDRVVFAHRYLIQGSGDGAPLHDLHRIQTSFRQQEGTGGKDTLRGVLKNRLVGRGLVVWNSELRVQVADFSIIGRRSRLVVSAFLDQGRVWAGQPVLSELFSNLHRGYGGGLRVGIGQDFTAAVDFGTSTETGLQIYIGLGYLY